MYYSIAEDGLYCVLFPDTSLRRSSKLITEPYENCKDSCEDLKTHVQCEHHCNSKAKLWAFRDTYDNPAGRIDITIAEENTTVMQHNRQVLRSILKWLEFCVRQGIASLRGHRDDEVYFKF